MRRWAIINRTRHDDQGEIGDVATDQCVDVRDDRRDHAVVDRTIRRRPGSDASHQVADQHGKHGGPMAPAIVDRKEWLQQ